MIIVHDHRGRQGPLVLLLLMAVLLTAAAGCASVPAYRSHGDLRKRQSSMRTVGLLPPGIRMFEEQPRFGMNKMEPHAEWAPAAADAVSKAVVDEMAAQGRAVVMVDAGDPELKEMDALFNAVQFSMLRHAWGEEQQGIVPSEPFPEQALAFDYSVGPIQEACDRYGVDAVWIVRGFNLLPTTGARVKEGVEVLIGILSAMGGGPGPMVLKKMGLSISLVDRNGSVLYAGLVDDQRVAQASVERPGATASRRELDPMGFEEREYLDTDLRDVRVARHFISAALQGYREEAPR